MLIWSMSLTSSTGPLTHDLSGIGAGGSLIPAPLTMEESPSPWSRTEPSQRPSCRRTDSTALSHQSGPCPSARDCMANLDFAGTLLNKQSHFLMLYPASILKTQRTGIFC